MRPLCSVIIPSYNSYKYIGETIRSVSSQTYSNIEIIVIDDCSEDNTTNLVTNLMNEDDRIILIRNENNIGVAETRNKGVQVANGEYIAFIDSDDCWLPTKLEKQIELMIRENIELSYTAYEMIDDKGQDLKKIFYVPLTVEKEELFKKNVIGCSTVVVRRGTMLKHPMRTEFYHEDFVAWLEILEECKVAKGVNEVLMKYRLMSGTKSRNKYKSALYVFTIYRKAFKLGLFKSSYYLLIYSFQGLKKYGVSSFLK